MNCVAPMLMASAAVERPATAISRRRPTPLLSGTPRRGISLGIDQPHFRLTGSGRGVPGAKESDILCDHDRERIAVADHVGWRDIESATGEFLPELAELLAHAGSDGLPRAVIIALRLGLR